VSGSKSGTGSRPRKRLRISLKGRRPSLATVIWSTLTLAVLIVAVVVQAAVWFIGAVVFALFAVVSAFGDFMGPDGMDGALPAQPRTTRKPAQPRGSGRPRSSGPVVRCTRTGQPIDKCSCARRHVASQDGADRYKRQVGDPLGAGARSA
jgi:hypothetical protein